MRIATKTLAAGTTLAALSLVALVGEAQGGRARGLPLKAVADLASVEPAVDEDARGGIAVKFWGANARRVERSKMVVKLQRLDGTDYSLWMDDPSTPETDLVEVTTFVTHGRGNARVRFDTKLEETMPFGATLADLGGKAFEIRDAAGVAVMVGTVPALPAVQ